MVEVSICFKQYYLHWFYANFEHEFALGGGSGDSGGTCYNFMIMHIFQFLNSNNHCYQANAGYRVITVQLPHHSLIDDVAKYEHAALKR